MKKTIAALLTVAMLAGCTTATRHGECVGLAQDQDPTKRYEISWWNGFMGLLFAETIIVPVVVLGYQIQCPVGEKVIPTGMAQ